MIVRVLRFVVVPVVALFFVAIGILGYQYRVMLTDVYNDLQYSSIRDIVYKQEFLAYFGSYLGKLHPSDGGFYVLVDEDSIAKIDTSELEGAKLLYHQGQFAKSAEAFRAIIDSQGESEERLFWLAMSVMRLAEQANEYQAVRDDMSFVRPRLSWDVAPNDDSATEIPSEEQSVPVSVLPVQFPHSDKTYTEKAFRLFSRLATQYNHKEPLYKWLQLYTAQLIDPAVTSTTYGLDSRFLRFFSYQASDESNIKVQFNDAAKRLGLDLDDTGKGVAVEDFDKDGYLDLVVGSSFGPLRFFRNVGGEQFIDETEQRQLGGVLQPYTISAVDYNNDGWMDLFVTRPYHHYQLFRNNHGESFQDVTHAAGLLPSDHKDRFFCTWHAAWADIDNDGDLDLLLSQWGQKMPLQGTLFDRIPDSSRLYINRLGKFVDRTEQFGLNQFFDGTNYVSAAFGDYDNDGYQDLFISSFSKLRSKLLRNIRGQAFREVQDIVRKEGGFTTAFVDVNHDGLLDLFHAGNAQAKAVIANLLDDTVMNLDPNQQPYTNTFFVQTGTGTFAKRSELFQDQFPITALGVSYGDVNNDGCHDFYLGTGNPESWFIVPNLMYLGKVTDVHCNGEAENISGSNGLASTQKGQGVVFFDYDNDGDQDIYSVQGGMWPGDKWPNRMLENVTSNRNTWIKIRLRGRDTNYFGVGATIKVVARDSKGREYIRFAVMNNKTGFGSTPYLAHIGLMQAIEVKYVDVTWPVSQSKKRYYPRLGELVTLDEEEGINKYS